MRLDRPVLSLCLGQILSSAALAAAQDVSASSAISTAHPSNSLSGSRSIETPSTTNTTSSNTRLPSGGTGGVGNSASADSPTFGNSTSPSSNTMITTTKALKLKQANDGLTSSLTKTSGTHATSITDLGSKSSGYYSSATRVGQSQTVSSGVPLSTGTFSGSGSLARLNGAGLGNVNSTTDKLLSNLKISNDSSTNPDFGVGINGEGKQASVEVSALPSGMNLSNIGVYGYTTVTLAPTDGHVRPDAGLAPQREVTVIPLTRPYKIGITTINGTPTSVIEWLPDASNFVNSNSTYNASAMQIGDKAPTMQQSVQGLDLPTTTAQQAAAQSDTAPQVTSVPASVVKSSTKQAQNSPVSVNSAAASVLGNVIDQLKTVATASSAQTKAVQQAQASTQASAQQQQQQQQQSGSQQSVAQQSASQETGSQQSVSQPEGQPVNLPSSDSTTTQKAPIVIVNPESSAVVVADLPVQSVQPALGNTNPEKVIQPQAISTVPSLAPIIPQTGFNIQSATAVMQQQAVPVQTSPAAQVNAGTDRVFEVQGNSIVQVNKQPNAAASVLAVAYTQATASMAGPKAVSVGNAAINIQAVPTSVGSGPREFIVGTQVASLGQTVTDNNTPIVIQTNGAGEPVAMVGTSAAATLLPVSAPVGVAPGGAELVVAGQTLGPAAPITIGPIQSATVVSLQTGANGEAEVVAGSSTMPLAAFISQHTDASLVTAPLSGPTVGSAPANVLVAGSETLGMGLPAITVGSALVSLATDHDGLTEVVAGSTTMPIASFLAANPSFTAEQIGGPSAKALAIGSQTLEMDSAITVGSSILALTTDAAGQTEVIENGSSTVPLAEFLTENPSASVVVNAVDVSSPALTLAGVTVAPVPGATDSAIVIGSMTLEPGESVTETFGTSATETFIYTTLANGSLGIVVMDASTTATRPLPTAFLAADSTMSTAVSDALPSKTSASQAGAVPLGSAAASWKRDPVGMLLGAVAAALLSLVVGVYLV